MLKSLHRFIIASNENWVVPAGADARRWFVLDAAPTHANDRAYFAAIDEEMDNGGLEALMHFLATYDLSNVDVYHAPKTAALLDQKMASLEPHEAWWLDTLEQGYIRRSSSEGVAQAEDMMKVNEWPETIIKEHLHESYQTWAKEHHARGRLLANNSLHRWFRNKNLLPDAKEHKPHGQRRALVLPSLNECRDAWDDMMGQPHEWQTKEDAEP